MISSDIPTSQIASNTLRRAPWLRTLSDQALEQTRLRLQRHHYARGETIIRRGVRGGFLGIVESGEAVLIAHTPGGRMFTTPLKPGESFALADDVPSAVTIQAATAMTLWTLEQADVNRPGPAPIAHPSSIMASRRSILFSRLALRPGAWRCILAAMIVVLIGAMALSPQGRIFRADVRYTRGLHAMTQQQWNVARRQFNATLRLNPTHAASYNNLGYIYAQQSNGEKALEAFEHAAALDANSDVIQNNLGIVQARFGMTDTALVNLQRAAELGGNTAPVYVNLGNFYRAMGDWTNAGRAYREALRMNPKLAVTHYNLGVVYYCQQQFTQARSEFERAVQINPNLAVGYVGLGVLDFEQENFAAAQKKFLYAIELNPQDAVAYFYLGLTQKIMGDWEQSAAAFEHVLDLTAPSLIHEQAEQHLQELDALP